MLLPSAAQAPVRKFSLNQSFLPPNDFYLLSCGRSPLPLGSCFTTSYCRCEVIPYRLVHTLYKLMLPSLPPAVKQFHLLAFYRAGGYTLCNLLAEEHVEKQHRNQSYHQCSELLSKVTT